MHEVLSAYHSPGYKYSVTIPFSVYVFFTLHDRFANTVFASVIVNSPGFCSTMTDSTVPSLVVIIT